MTSRVPPKDWFDRAPARVEPSDRRHVGLRTLDNHASWREVYYACGVEEER
ncbi:hypothetical protein ACFQH3_13785 [Haladaptatus sp. GCM10025707]|uniref:hypothetical protein n=1 Tax=unclassified Haladaptatus TaxID=2622732 RepID=UPI0023E85257|nr:hypothetical protein [Haladaptatus sp. QDMS2]